VTLEQEVKLGVWPGFVLPDLGDVADGVVAETAPSLHLEATYHDTPSLAMARWGITLRFRTGDAGDDRWTLKLPKGARGNALVRDEVDIPGDAGSVPEEIRGMVVAWVRSAPLGPVATLHTERLRTVLRDADGKQMAEVVDDEVSVLDDRHVALRFREVEVEIASEAGDRILDEVVSRLRGAGAGAPDPTPKVVRALGPRALSEPDVVVPALPNDPTAAEVLRAGIAKAVLRILSNDAGVRLGEDPEAVHQARVGTRRLRSDLRTFATLLDRDWSEPLREELSWYAGLLGGVRDADVLLERLSAETETLEPVDAVHALELLAVVRAEREIARRALGDSMATPRYVALLDRLVDATRDPHVLPAAGRPARRALPLLVAEPWQKLAKAAKNAGRDPDDVVLHGIRIRAKRARYAADVAALVVGKPAARFATAVAGVQEVLGEHQDACIRRAWLRDNAGALSPGAALVAGQLVARAERTAEEGRREWERAWKQAGEGRLRTWLNR
jgi:CHAD domain-containing protein